MRTIAILLLALCASVVVLAKKDDVACVIHSDDCGKCVSNGCNWCSDGYCVSTESDICEASKVTTSCLAKAPAIVHQARQGPAAALCEEKMNECGACTSDASCFLCVDSRYKLWKCSSSSTCESATYGTAYEWWLPAIGLPNVSFVPGPCPAKRPPATDSPGLIATFLVYLFGDVGTEGTCAGLAAAFVEGKLLATIQAILPPPLFDATGITTLCDRVTRKRVVLPDVYEANILAKFSDFGDFTAQGIAATIVDQAPEVFTVDTSPGAQPITAGPYLPTSGATGQVESRRRSNNASLSRGALAGIIIGCIIFGAILIALILWLVLRKRDSYPQAFRSPAAAYRP